MNPNTLMQTTPSSQTLRLSAVLFFLALAAQAGNVFRADTADALNLPTAWTGGATPTAADVAVWNNAVQVNNTSLLGADTNWAGIQMLDPALPVTINAGNTLTLGAAGIDMSQATNGLTLANAVSNAVSQTWNVAGGQMLTVSGVVSGPGTAVLTQSGNGTLVLGAANTYSGGTVVNGGSVQPGNAASFGTGAVTNNGGTLSFATFPASGVIKNTVNFTGTSRIDMAGFGSLFVLSGALSGNGTILVTNDTASGSTLTFGGNGNGGGNMTAFTGSIVVVTNASGTPSAGTLRFNNSSANNNVGNPAMSVDLGINSTVIFASRNNTTTSIGELKGGPGTAVSGNTGNAGGTANYSIGGKNTSSTFNGNFVNKSATAITALTKVGAGAFTMTGTNTFTGPITISAGTLQMGDGGADGVLGGGNVANAAALVFNRSDAYIIGNNITGAGTVTVQAGGIQTYTGTNSSSGATIISQGTLVLGASGLLSCPISVAAGATFDVSQNPSFSLNQTLSGYGTVTGLLAAAGGTISPGGSGAAGTLNFSNGITESGNANHALELSGVGGTNDLINIVGDLTVSGINNITLSHFGGGTIPNGTYTLFTYSGNLVGGLGNFAVFAPGGNIGTLANPPNQITVTIQAGGRGPTNLTWVGDGGANIWDFGASNWVNGATSLAFQTGDSVRFDAAGAANPNVNLNVTVLPASVTVSNTTDYTISGNGNISDQSGLLQTALIKTNAGTLTLLTTNSYSGPTIIGGGTLVVSYLANGALPSGIGAASSSPTNLVFFGTTLGYIGASAGTDRGATLNGAGGTFDVISGTTLTLGGALTGPGALTKFDTGTLTLNVPNTYSGGTVISNGVLALGGNLANSDGAGGSGLGATNNPVTFYGGTLQLFGYSGSTSPNYNTVYNPLVVPAGQSGTLRMWPRGPGNSGANSGLKSSLTGSGTLNLVVNYIRDNLDGNWSAFTGLINVTPKPSGGGDEMRINNSFGYANASVFLNDGVLMDYQLAANATVDIGELGGTSLSSVGTGSLSPANTTWRVGFKNTDQTFNGTIASSVSITKVGTGTWSLSGLNTYTGSTTISNGVLALTNGVSGDGAISGSASIFINAGAALDVIGRSDGTLPLNPGQVISGNGTLRGILDTTAGGTVSPGGGITGGLGTLTVTNTINLGGTAWMKLNRASSPNSDRLVSAPASGINYGGTLVVTNTGPALQAGDTFTLFSATTLNNSFTLALPNYYAWNTSQLSVSGQISVTAVLPPPAITNVDFSQLSAGSITLNANNGAPNGPVVVLTSTNLALPLSGWTTVISTTFDGSGNLSLPVTVDPTLPQSFYLLQVY